MTDILHAIGGVMLLGIPISLIMAITCDDLRRDALSLWVICYLAYFLLAAVGFAGVVGFAMLVGAFR